MDVHPSLRVTGSLFNLFLPFFTGRKFRMANFALGALKGHHPRGLGYRQIYLTRDDGSSLRLCVYAPVHRHENGPGLLWLHGGGYALGVPEQDESFVRRFVDAGSSVVVVPDYRLSTEAPYPAALEDCRKALGWLKDHGREYGMRSDQIFVGGDSAGGGLAAALALYERDRKDVSIAFLMALYPMIDDRMNTPAAMNNTAPVWNSRSNNIGWKLYLGKLFETESVPSYAAPARAESLREMPPTCSYVGSIDPFRDDTVNYIKRLQADGVPACCRVFDGCFHGFDIVCPKSDVAQEATGFLMECFRSAMEHCSVEQPGEA